MPKKKNKTRKKGKGKGKREEKREITADMESEAEKAKASAALWEARLNVTEASRAEYREATRRLAQANEELASQRRRAEKDAADVVAFLKLKEAEKEQKIVQLEEELREQEEKAREQRERMASEYTLKINELEENFRKRSRDFQVTQGELQMIMEFRKKKAQMEQELHDLKEKVHHGDRDHRESLAQTERKFFRQKICLEEEAEQQVARLAEKAHKEAIVQLDEASRVAFAENIRLNEALRYHLKEAEELRKSRAALLEEKGLLALHKETSEMMVLENVTRLKRQAEEIAALKEEVTSLERTLGHMDVKFQREQREAQHRLRRGAEAAQAEADRLQKALATQGREVGRVKWLARHLVEQRTELESFFHEALEKVRQEVRDGQEQCYRGALGVYRHETSDVWVGRRHISAFNWRKQSTNRVCADVKKADERSHLQGAKVDISQLTWEQKEKVLRLLFARMNGLRPRKSTQPLTLPQSAKKDNNVDNPRAAQAMTKLTFITQTPECTMPLQVSRLPPIKTS